MNPLDLRAAIPGLEGDTYLNFGAHGPSPRPVVEAATSFQNRFEFARAGSEDPYEVATTAWNKTRERVATFIGANPEAIALTESTTDGINAITAALGLTAGDVVVRTDLEHPAGTLPFERLQREGVTVKVLETTEGRVDRNGYISAIDDADLVCFSALTWTHGTRLHVGDLIELAHEAGALTLVDAVQWPGQAPLDVSAWNVDALAAASHKWLLSLWGGGFLYVNEAVMDEFEPPSVGYRSVVDPLASPFEFHPSARRFEIGSANPAPHVALQTALEHIEAIGVVTIESRIGRLTNRLLDHLPHERVLSPSSPESGLVTIRVDEPEVMVDRLASAGFVIRSLPFPRAIRASVHAVNTTEEIDAFAAELTQYW